MNPPSPTILNPCAPLYIPIASGITPVAPPHTPPYHPPPPFFHPCAVTYHHQTSTLIFSSPVPLYTQAQPPLSSFPPNFRSQNPNITTIYLPLLPPPLTSTVSSSQPPAVQWPGPSIATTSAGEYEGVLARALGTRTSYFESTGRGGSWQRDGGSGGRRFGRGGWGRRGGRGRGFSGRGGGEGSSHGLQRRKPLNGKSVIQARTCATTKNFTNLVKHQKWEKLEMQQKDNSHKVFPLKRDEEKTTIMLKNIPYDYTSKALLRFLDEFCALENGSAKSGVAAYDFFYYPIDFGTKKGRGFAFINFTNPTTVWKFFDAFQDKKGESVEWKKWPKTIEIVSAKIQGKEALTKHFTDSIFECESDEFLPVAFSPARDGSSNPAMKVTVVGKRRAARCYWEPKG